MPYDTPYNRKLAEQIKNINERYLAHCREEVMRPFITGAGAVEEEIDEPENYDIIEVTAKPRKQRVRKEAKEAQKKLDRVIKEGGADSRIVGGKKQSEKDREDEKLGAEIRGLKGKGIIGDIVGSLGLGKEGIKEYKKEGGSHKLLLKEEQPPSMMSGNGILQDYSDRLALRKEGKSEDEINQIITEKNKPKPKNAWHTFLADFRKENKDKYKGKELIRKASEEYQKNKPEKAPKEKKEKALKESKPKKEKALKESKPREKTAWHKFLADFRKENPEIKGKEIMLKASKEYQKNKPEKAPKIKKEKVVQEPKTKIGADWLKFLEEFKNENKDKYKAEEMMEIAYKKFMDDFKEEYKKNKDRK